MAKISTQNILWNERFSALMVPGSADVVDGKMTGDDAHFRVGEESHEGSI